jgi:5'(3')-deoxyribonucleotidase
MPKIIVVDVDGVLRNFVKQLAKVYNRDFPDHPATQVTTWDMKIHFPLIQDLPHYFDHKHPQEIYEEAEMFEGSREFLLKLKDLGYFIVLASAQMPQNYVYTINWFQKHDLTYDAICFTRDKSIFHADYLLDDGIHNLKSFKHGMPIAMDQKWNKDWHGARVFSFDEMIEFMIFSCSPK